MGKVIRAAVLICSVLLLSLGSWAGAEEPSKEEALRGPVAEKIAQLDAKITELRAVGATDDDLKEVDQLFRIAKGSAKRGQYAEADVNLSLALPMVEKIRTKVGTDTLERIQLLDAKVSWALDEAKAKLVKDPPNERWASIRYEEARKLAEERNALARKCPIPVAEKDFAPLFEPVARRLGAAAGQAGPAATAAPAQVGSASGSVPKGKYETKYKDLILRVRGFEPDAFRAGVTDHLQGQYAEAARQYQEVLRSDPDDYRSLFNLGVLEMQIGDYQTALGHLKKAFDIGLQTDSLDKGKGANSQSGAGISIMSKASRKEDKLDVWRGQFLPEVGPLKDACQETGNVRLAQEVDAALQKRKAEVQERERQEKEARIPKIETPTPTPTETPEEGEEQVPEDKVKSKLKGKVQLARPGATPQEVTDTIGQPDNIKAKGNATLYYYPTGTVVFVDGKVKTAEPRMIDLGEIP